MPAFGSPYSMNHHFYEWLSVIVFKAKAASQSLLSALKSGVNKTSGDEVTMVSPTERGMMISFIWRDSLGTVFNSTKFRLLVGDSRRFFDAVGRYSNKLFIK